LSPSDAKQPLLAVPDQPVDLGELPVAGALAVIQPDPDVAERAPGDLLGDPACGVPQPTAAVDAVPAPRIFRNSRRLTPSA